MSEHTSQQAATRESLTAATFVELIDTLVGDFDVIEVLTVLTSRCIELLDAAAAGILLADSDGHLRVIGASTDEIALLELFQLQNDAGPCLDCYRSGQVLVHSHLDRSSPWPEFAAECVRAGYPSVCAIPLRLRTTVLGCLNLFMAQPVGLSDEDVALAQALADVASITILQDQAARDAAIREGHLEHALTSRIAIEQAKGMIAEHRHIGMDQAFSTLRAYARNHNLRLTDVAEAVVAGTLAVSVVGATRTPTVPRGRS
jgi:GAF domain-containing protein